MRIRVAYAVRAGLCRKFKSRAFSRSITRLLTSILSSRWSSEHTAHKATAHAFLTDVCLNRATSESATGYLKAVTTVLGDRVVTSTRVRINSRDDSAARSRSGNDVPEKPLSSQSLTLSLRTGREMAGDSPSPSYIPLAVLLTPA